MALSLYDASIPQLTKMLANLETWIDEAVEYAKTRNFDPNVLLEARLAPDQFALVKQIQSSADQAKFCAARLTGKEPPKHADTEKTLDELRIRLRAVREYLGTFKREEFEGAEKREIRLPFLEGKVLSGQNYLFELLMPNFYFHVTTAYAILRNNGVALGKMPYLGALTFE
ncbi:MAG TPA: DUF1993 domain-containing protein [Polyangiaceae bacterium]|nr:DUF1993 domain-containing protein [Polyangiaceae bacterium]